MLNQWKELLAIDRYSVTSSSILHDFDWKIITMLYQPIVGYRAYSLYMTLWGEHVFNKSINAEHTHHNLIVGLQCTIAELIDERKKLEAIGLLKTYFKLCDDTKHFSYELIPPLTPQEFFNDGVLNVILFERLGRTIYLERKEMFRENSSEISDATDITVPFNHVYKPANSSFSQLFEIDINSNDLIKRSKPETLTIENNFFDFDLFIQGLSDYLIPKSQITFEVKETIIKLAYLYSIGPLDMQKVLLSSIDDNSSINIELLRKNARSYYQLQTGSIVPSINSNEYKTDANIESKSKDEKLIYELERMSPLEFLTSVSNGSKPPQSEIQIVERLLENQKLSNGVINVLLYYVLLKTDMKLTKSYVEKIAAHWIRKGIKNAKDAMELAKSEHRQYQEWATKKSTTPYRKKPIRTEMIPDWMKSDETTTSNPVAEKILQKDFQDEKKKLEQKLNNYLLGKSETKGE
ncbi:MAG: replication initiation and rane attachment family protein [Bacillales bacterium]|jgi:replication initiation and membrane attachment protein|nr:replication initiation and rane attachment family protein [Bacillales bacterium]